MLSSTRIRARIQADHGPTLEAPRRAFSCWAFFSWLICNMSISSFGHIPSSMPHLLLGPDARQAHDGDSQCDAA
jgi:hypothetical protein